MAPFRRTHLGNPWKSCNKAFPSINLEGKVNFEGEKDDAIPVDYAKIGGDVKAILAGATSPVEIDTDRLTPIRIEGRYIT